VLNDDNYDWEGDQPLNHPLEQSVIYELHVGGFTRNPSAQVAHPGTFSAVIEKIPYLKSLVPCLASSLAVYSRQGFPSRGPYARAPL
jgi:hypothetical protein